MTTRFRIDRILIDSLQGEIEYNLPSPLTVFAGGVGVGKSTLFELIKYGLGGRGLLADVVRSNVTSISLDIAVGVENLRLVRTVSAGKISRKVFVFDLNTQASIGDLSADGSGADSISSLLLTSMGLPDDVKAAPKVSTSTNQGAKITFNDVFRYMYISQGDINEQIAASSDNYYQPKRKAVFELLFDLTNREILEKRSKLARVRGEWEVADREHQLALRFLSDTKTRTRQEVEATLERIVSTRDAATREIETIRASIDASADREERTLRELLSDSETRVLEAETQLAILRQQRSDFDRERNRIEGDIEKVKRTTSATESLSGIEFVTCPRCLQGISERGHSRDVCPLCLQVDPMAENADIADVRMERDMEHLVGQIGELGAQIGAIDVALNDVSEALDARLALRSSLSEKLRGKGSIQMGDAIQQFADATKVVAESDVLRNELEKTLIQWDRADDLFESALSLRGEIDDLTRKIDEEETILGERRDELLSELSLEFDRVVAEVGIPGVEDASISGSTYLPVINGQSFDKFSPVGGVRTAVQVSYWVTLLNVSLRRRDTWYPAFMLLDSPRTSLNNDDDLSAALYKLLVTAADVAEDRVQMVIGDNELPATYRGAYAQIDFSYERPAISTVRHPGRDAVTTIGG